MIPETITAKNYLHSWGKLRLWEVKDLSISTKEHNWGLNHVVWSTLSLLHFQKHFFSVREVEYFLLFIQFSSVQSLSCVQLFATPWIAARQASLSITISQSSLKLTSIKLVMPSSHLILCRPLFLLPPISPSIRVFSNESTLRMRWPKYWSFSYSIIPSKKNPGLISGPVGSPCSPRDSQESSPIPQFKSINSLALSFLHSPTLTSIHDHWKNHSLD